MTVMVRKEAATPIGDATSRNVGTMIRELNRLVTRFYDTRLRSHGLTLAQFHLLSILASSKGIHSAQVGAAISIEKSTLSRNLRRMLKAGWIVMEAGNRRTGRPLRLTESGNAKLVSAMSAWRAAEAQAQQAFAAHISAIAESVQIAKEI